MQPLFVSLFISITYEVSYCISINYSQLLDIYFVFLQRPFRLLAITNLIPPLSFSPQLADRVRTRLLASLFLFCSKAERNGNTMHTDAAGRRTEQAQLPFPRGNKTSVSFRYGWIAHLKPYSL